MSAIDFSDISRTPDALSTVPAVDAYRPKTEPYKVTLDRGVQAF